MRVGIQCRPAASRSLPVTTATTPGTFSASELSMFRIFACAYGLRTMSMNSMPGNLTSSMYLPMPRRNRGSSLRLTLWPMPPRVADASGMGCLLHRFGLLLAHLRGAVLDGFDDIHVARTAAQVAADATANLGLARARVAGQQRGGSHDHARGAEAAL